LVPDLDAVNSWTQRVDEVDALELLEVQLCNVTAPFVLVSRLRSALAASSARRTYVVNVSAMEGQFGRGYKGAGHPHTNMAKAALNMLTRTSAEDLFTDGIVMASVDTGWITDERPHPTKARLADEGFHAPLDLVDGAARVYDPIVRGELGEDLIRTCVSGDVGQGLLDHTKGRDLDLRGVALLRHLVLLQMDGDARGRLEALDMPLHRDEESVAVEDLWPQVQGKLAHLLRQPSHGHVHVVEGCLATIALGGGNLEREAGENLPDLVVQLERETATLLLLHQEQPS